MGTRALIACKRQTALPGGFTTTDYVSVYCGHDGYPTGVGAGLLKFHKTPEKALALCTARDLTYLHSEDPGTWYCAEDGLNDESLFRSHASLDALYQVALEYGVEYAYCFAPGDVDIWCVSPVQVDKPFSWVSLAAVVEVEARGVRSRGPGQPGMDEPTPEPHLVLRVRVVADDCYLVDVRHVCEKWASLGVQAGAVEKPWLIQCGVDIDGPGISLNGDWLGVGYPPRPFVFVDQKERDSHLATLEDFLGMLGLTRRDSGVNQEEVWSI